MKGKEVKKILLNSGIKLSHLAKLMGISPQNLQNILRSENLSSGRIEEIQRKSGVELVEYKFGGNFELIDDSENTPIRKRVGDSRLNEAEINYNITCPDCREKQEEINYLKQQLRQKSDHIDLIDSKRKRIQDQLDECLKGLPQQKPA